MLVQTQNGQIICNMDYLLSIRMEEKVGMSLLTAIPVSGDEISLGIFFFFRKMQKGIGRFGTGVEGSEKTLYKIPADK
ncbi:MAG: hypothetical protein ACLTX3_08850 [Lachnospiraceae bacterium]